MRMSDKIRDGINKHREGGSEEEELRGLINSVASKSLRQFIQRLDAGEVPIDNMSDFARVLGIYKEINEITTSADGQSAQASLPEINLRQERVLNDQEGDGKITADEEGNIDVSSLSEDDVTDLIRQMDIAQNTENEEAF